VLLQAFSCLSSGRRYAVIAGYLLKFKLLLLFCLSYDVPLWYLAGAGPCIYRVLKIGRRLILSLNMSPTRLAKFPFASARTVPALAARSS